MNSFMKYCEELKKEYELNDVNSAKASAYRQKLLRILRKLDETEDCPKAIAAFWKYAYYNPLSKLRGSDTDTSWLSTMIHVFKGELIAQLAGSTKHVALYNLYLGDLARYLPGSARAGNTNALLATVHYKRTIEANPDLGQAYNQLGLLEKCHIASIRYFILAISAGSPFRLSLDNLKKKLQEPSQDRQLILFKELLSCFFLSYSSNMDTTGSQLVDIVTSQKNAIKNEQLPLLVNTLVLANNIVDEYCESSGVLKLSSIICDLLSHLVDQIETFDEEEEIMVTRRRRRRSSSDDEDELDSEEDDDARRPSQRHEKKRPQSGNVWPLSVTCEWILIVYSTIEKMKEKQVPIPAAFTNNLDSFIEKVMTKLNNLLKILNAAIEEELEETEWLLNGPILGRDEISSTRCLQQLCYWSAILPVSDVSPIEFAGYFRRCRKGSSKQDMLRKMAELHLKDSVTKNVDSNWLPLFIVLDYDVLVQHLAKLRRIVKTHTVIPVVPSFVLAQLDKMKGTGPSVRAAMRFIEQNQKTSDLRVQEAHNHYECCEFLLTSFIEPTDKLKTVVSLIVTDLEKFHSMTIDGVTVYHVESFYDRWEKTTGTASKS